ncbi:acyltransferase [Acinetobacter sp. ANC 5380]|uniref:Acyltransferase n=1 Tax=Acinetobacter terrae TaxID=2731247 RepID=A0A7Y2RHS6_9GAMM|nr:MULTISPECIES: acyltransferase family protein [Acinetobacter]NNH78716.1 acyltransferase [Acinetobacter terrae]
MYDEKFYRYDIQGLRAISALIIMIYHIWLNKVSGGVDVFFVISGFLIGTQFLRSIEKNGTIYFFVFWSRILSRIAPTACFVILCTAILTLVFIPPALWKMGINEFITSTLNLQNWELYRTSTNYLAKDNPPSQYQQFWALSIQIQFYLIVITIFICSSFFIKKKPKFNMYLILIILIILISFIYSIYFTNISPEKSYFSTGTRLWEFGFGLLAAYFYPYAKRIKIKNKISTTLYLSSFIIFLFVGLFIPSSINYPGYISLVPVLCAFLFILIGSNIRNDFLLKKILAIKFMQKMGDLSFTIYLWHWPLLIFSQYYLDTTDISLTYGLMIILLAIIFSYLTHKLVEYPTLNYLRSCSIRKSIFIIFIILASISSLGIVIRFKMIKEAHTYFSNHLEYLEVHSLPIDKANIFPELKTLILSNYDRPEAINKCLSGPICIYGKENSNITVALVGASHAAQWQPVLEYAANKYNFKLVTILSLPKDTTRLEINKINPDVIVTTSTITNEKNSNEVLNDIEFWKDLTEDGIKVIGIRDNPRFSIYQNSCISKNPDNLLKCSLSRDQVFQKENIAEIYEKEIDGFYSVDLTKLICFEKLCPSTVNGIIIYYDKHHFSNSFMTYISKIAVAEIVNQAPGVLNK